MSFTGELRILRQLISGARRGSQHASRLEQFYEAQAEDYDRFRARLLPGRRELLDRIEVPAGARVVDMGGGTGANLDSFSRHDRVDRWTIVDLSPSLLGVARQRCKHHGFTHVDTVEADACSWTPDEAVDLIIFSYSLTMIPDWMDAIDHAASLLKPGGQIAVVDFTVSRKYPEPGLTRHGAFTRAFWPLWFSWDDVFLNPDHIPYLRRRFRTIGLHEDTTRLPYLPGSRVPWYQFIGETRGDRS